MKITRFQFEDRRTGWRLEETPLDAFNLFVGVSGVGKTKILDALRRVCGVATDIEYNPGPAAWRIQFEHASHPYVWEACTEEVQNDVFPEASITEDRRAPTEIASERVVQGESEVLVERSDEAFLLGAKDVPKLKREASALALLESDERIAPLRGEFQRVLFSHAAQPATSRYNSKSLEQRVDEHRRLSAKEDGFNLFREVLADGGLRTLARHVALAAYYCQEAFPDRFERLQDMFIGMFPSVREIAVRSSRMSTGVVQIDFALREEGASDWISQAEMSSGMLRTLVHLFEVSLAPAGSVIVIDEFENSLGMNCMPSLTSFLLTRSDCQFILTSHHPYVINNLPTDTWKLVRRTGSVVRVISARDIPALQASSHHEAFIRLLNLPEFEEGIG